jgi:hypothetical protein
MTPDQRVPACLFAQLFVEELDVWVHVAVVYDAPRSARIYRNTVLLDVNSESAFVLPAYAVALLVPRAPGPSRHFD